MADRLDSRQLIERIDEIDNTEDLPEVGTEEYYQELMKEKDEIKDLLKELRELSNSDSPEDGIQLIPKDNFVDYAQEFADDVGMTTITHQNIHGFMSAKVIEMWPFKHIDWEAAAEELAQDWTEIEFRGVTYYAR